MLKANGQLSNHYQRSLHADQPVFVQVLCEAAGMVPMVEGGSASFVWASSLPQAFRQLDCEVQAIHEARGANIE